MNFPGFGGQEKSDITITLTPIGKEKAEKFSLSGPKFEVLASLLEEGTMTLAEIAEKTRMNAYKVREVSKSLAASGYIKMTKIPC